MLSDYYQNKVQYAQLELSLNPCSNGICSLTDGVDYTLTTTSEVLILVLMEYAL